MQGFYFYSLTEYFYNMVLLLKLRSEHLFHHCLFVACLNVMKWIHLVSSFTAGMLEKLQYLQCDITISW